jgi:hypothetical protein
MGSSVAFAGDVNGDGYDDVVVGESHYDEIEGDFTDEDEGRAHVFHGSAAGLVTTAAWTAEETRDLSLLGTFVSSAGDVNGDGFDDVIVGAPGYGSDFFYEYYEDRSSAEGRALVYLGSPTGLDAAAVWRANGPEEFHNLGRSVASAGDVNGDGFDDVIVGAPHTTQHYEYFSEETGIGNAYVFHGSSSGPSLVADWTVEGEQIGDFFGSAVDGAGDVNGDGFSDVVVGARGHGSYGLEDVGAARLYLGSPYGLALVPDSAVVGTEESTSYGFDVSSAGDIDADGLDDVVIGEPFFQEQPFIEVGRVFVYRGRCTDVVDTDGDDVPDGCDLCPGTPDPTQEDDDADGVGNACDPCPAEAFELDSDADGACDEVDCDDTDPTVYPGALQICDGIDNTCTGVVPADEVDADSDAWATCDGDCDDLRSDVHPTAPEVCNGIDDDCEGSVSLAEVEGDVDGFPPCAGDCNDADPGAGPFQVEACGDGIDNNCNGAADEDCPAAGGCGCDGAHTLGGVTGTLGLLSIVAVLVRGRGRGAWMLVQVACSPAGPPAAPPVVASAASYGREEGTMELSWTGESNKKGAEFGHAVSDAGDVNGDGYGDVIVGAPLFDGSLGYEHGRVYLYLGAATGLEATPAWTATGAPDGALLGHSVAGAGDVNGDGYADVLVGAPFMSVYADDGDDGSAYVYLGSQVGLESTASWAEDFDTALSNFGEAVSAAGDVDGDGYGDVIVGASNYDNGALINAGAVYVYRGSAAGVDATPAAELVFDELQGDFGYSVSTAGDVDADGFGDVVVGAPGYGSTDEGSAFLYFGSAAGLETVAGLQLGADEEHSDFGVSVSTAGDVDGDGFGDVIIGALSFPYVHGGKVSLFHGSASGLDVIPRWTMESEQLRAEFGTSVSSAGDVNGDGFGDVVIGAEDWDSAAFEEEGKAEVFLGSAAGLEGAPAFTFGVGQSSAASGRSVSSAGDVDGDGYDDVVVGAPEYDDGESDEGGAFVYLGRCSDHASDVDGDGVGDGCDACTGDDASGDGDVDGVCASDAEGYVLDCDDTNPAIHPEALELCDGLDNRCAGTVPADELDLDGDAVRACDGDCDDADPNDYPGAVEVCDGEHNSCTGTFPADESDGDADSFMPCEGDCNDHLVLASPMMVELCSDDIDNNCDGDVDEGCSVATPAPSGSCSASPPTGAGLSLGAAGAALLLLRPSRSRSPLRRGLRSTAHGFPSARPR